MSVYIKIQQRLFSVFAFPHVMVRVTRIEAWSPASRLKFNGVLNFSQSKLKQLLYSEIINVFNIFFAEEFGTSAMNA